MIRTLAWNKIARGPPSLLLRDLYPAASHASFIIINDTVARSRTRVAKESKRPPSTHTYLAPWYLFGEKDTVSLSCILCTILCLHHPGENWRSDWLGVKHAGTLRFGSCDMPPMTFLRLAPKTVAWRSIQPPSIHRSIAFVHCSTCCCLFYRAAKTPSNHSKRSDSFHVFVFLETVCPSSASLRRGVRHRHQFMTHVK
jgi:hypothetical protein